MSKGRLFVYDPINPERDGVLALLCSEVEGAARKVHIIVRDPTRSLEQNDRMWAMLTDVSKQVQWPVNGKMQKISPEDWKHIFSSSLSRESRVAQGLDGGFVLLGERTSRMTKRELSDLMEMISAFGAERGVVFGEPKSWRSV